MWIENLEGEITRYDVRSEERYMLRVRTGDRRKVTNIVIIHTDGDTSHNEGWNFVEDKPVSCYVNNQPRKRVRGMDSKYNSDFIDLGVQVPSLKNSLENCVAFLMKKNRD